MTADRGDGKTSKSSPTPSSEEGEHKRSASPVTDNAAVSDKDQGATATGEPPLPEEDAPPLPDEAPPEDDGWSYSWDYNAGAYYFENRFTGQKQWDNPRVPSGTKTANYGSYDRYANSSSAPVPTTSSGAPGTSSSPPRRRWGGYNPAIHGNYDPNADYALEAQREEEEAEAVAANLSYPNQDYSVQANFNRFTGKFQQAGMGPDMHNDENKSRRQMNAFFDVDAAANSHDGRSLKAERRGKTLTKKELKGYQTKRREKKEEKRRAWLRD